MDHAQAARAGGGRPLDLAPAPGLRPTPLGARPGGRCAPPLAGATATRAAHPRTSPPRLFARAGTAGQSGQRAETLRAVARAAQRHALAACHTLSRRQINALTHPSLRVPRHTPAIFTIAGYSLLVKA